jgi:MoxR-like ATPase
VTQLDRFLFQILIDYPDEATEFEVIARTTAVQEEPLAPVLSRAEVQGILALPRKVEVPEGIAKRAVDLGRATRPAEGEAPAATRELLAWGAGPRGVQAILAAARASAVLAGRDRVEPSDYEEVVAPALRHRILLSYHAEAERMTPDLALRRIRREIGDWRGEPEEAAAESPPLWRRWLGAVTDTTPPFRGR